LSGSSNPFSVLTTTTTTMMMMELLHGIAECGVAIIFLFLFFYLFISQLILLL